MTLAICVGEYHTLKLLTNKDIQIHNVETKQLYSSQTTNAQGEVVFDIPESQRGDFFNIMLINDWRYETMPCGVDDLDIGLVTPNNYQNRVVKVYFQAKTLLYFNGVSLQIISGDEVLDTFQAHSGKPLNAKEKVALQQEKDYKHFVPHKDEHSTAYYCFDKAYQQDAKGPIPKGTYYININEIQKDSKTSDAKIHIYTDEECSDSIESSTSRDGFYIHSGDEYTEICGIDLSTFEATNQLIALKENLAKCHSTSLAIRLIVDYSHNDLYVDSIDISHRIIDRVNHQHKICLVSKYEKKPNDMSQEIYHLKTSQTYWAYVVLGQGEVLDETTINANIQTFNNAKNMAYQGESIEIDLVANDWHNYDKQVIVFAYTHLNFTLNDNDEEILQIDTSQRVITWFNPITNPRVTIFSFKGFNDRIEIAMFGNFVNRTKGIHQGIDLFANVGTPVYAPVDAKVVDVFSDFNSTKGFGGKIILAVSGNELEILRIRRVFINYQLAYQSRGEMTCGVGFDEDADTYYLFYAHLSRINVVLNDSVKAGQVIGYSGVSGNANRTNAPHLHFEIRDRQSAYGLAHRVNPAFYLQCKINYNEFDENEKAEQQDTCRAINNNENRCILPLG